MRQNIHIAAPWPPEPSPLSLGSSREERLQKLQAMRQFWNEINAERRSRIREEVDAARQRKQKVDEYWDQHKKVVIQRWLSRRSDKNPVTVADFPELVEQWHPANPGSPDQVSASRGGRVGETSPYFWCCPLGLGHPAWAAWPKDRVQRGTGCPDCRNLLSLADVPTLAEQYRGELDPKKVPFTSHDVVDWECRTWAVDPETGKWHKVKHHFTAVVKDRTQQGHGCRVCAGYVIDSSNSLLTWFPEIAAELDDDSLDPATLSTSRHNATRKAGIAGNKYEKLPWRCRHGHRWLATIAQRVNGSGCPQCSTSGLSKEQVRLTAELAQLLELISPDRPDPRLPDGLPDFGSHRIPVPEDLKPSELRSSHIEVDAIFRLGNHLIGLEYDGAFYHSTAHRNRVTFTELKDRILVKLGYLPVRVRLGQAPDLNSSDLIIVKLDERSTAHDAAKEVALALERRLQCKIPGLETYIQEGRATASDLAEQYINCVWGVKQLRTRKRKTEGTTRKQRKLRATPPARGSLLIPDGPPYRSPEKKGVILRDYICKCGHRVKGLVQADVTRGNTRSCGCLADSARRQPRQAIPRRITQQARRWAVERGIPVSENGRLAAPVLASYLLHSVNQSDLPVDERGILMESAIRDWAVAQNFPLLARGRLPERVWFEYAFAHGASI